MLAIKCQSPLCLTVFQETTLPSSISDIFGRLVNGTIFFMNFNFHIMKDVAKGLTTLVPQPSSI